MMQPDKEPMTGEQRQAILEALTVTLVAKRKEAVDGRLSSGIEDQWREDEEFYQGYDDANRHEFVKAKNKPGEHGQLAQDENRPATESTVFPNLTQPYVDAAAARVGDMLLPTDDRNFTIDIGPIPDVLDEGEGFPEVQAAQPGAQVDSLTAAVNKAQSILTTAREKAKNAQTLIDDYLTECQFHAEVRKNIDEAAKLGSAVLKGPFPVKRRVSVFARNPETGERELVIKEETKPASKYISVWNFYPDPACGDNIQDGNYVFEREHLSTKKLLDLKGGEGAARYDDAQIDAAIEEGPDRRNELSNGVQTTTSKDMFTVWYFQGNLSSEELEAIGCACEGEKQSYPVIVTMVNDRIIKAALNPLDSGQFSYDVMVWKAIPGSPWGQGIARQGRTAQRIAVAATRALMDNAGASARPHRVMTGDIEQDGDPWTWRANSDVADVSRAMMFFTQPSLQAELMNIIGMAEKMMETHTGMPLILLGMQGSVQETAAGRQIQNNNGTSVLRRIARLFDSRITEPHIRRYYEWIMQYSEDEKVKGDFQIKARGSAALIERDIQNQQMPMLMNLSLNPAFGMDPEKASDEFLKSQRFTPETFKLSDQKKKELAQRQPPQAPQVAVAQIREQGQTQREQMRLQHEAQQGDLDRAIKKMDIEVQAQIDAAALGSEERLFLENVKADLAGITLKLNTQRELSGQVLAPPSEPAGRAPNGQAFQR